MENENPVIEVVTLNEILIFRLGQLVGRVEVTNLGCGMFGLEGAARIARAMAMAGVLAMDLEIEPCHEEYSE